MYNGDQLDASGNDGVGTLSSNGNGRPDGAVMHLFNETLARVDALNIDTGMAHEMITAFAERSLKELVPLDQQLAREKAIRHLGQTARLKAPARVVTIAFTQAQQRLTPNDAPKISLVDPVPAADPVNGAKLLSALSAWIDSYVHLSRHAADAVALWCAATWFADAVYFAPLLAILSPTKRCGKTTLMELVRLVVRRGMASSGPGVTTAVLFRLNEERHPTFCIDEAEKLSGRDADKDLVGLLNQGHRRGSKVYRIGELNGQRVTEEYDAFGFRALASTRVLWDTLMDRSIIVQMSRKPSGAPVRRFAFRTVQMEAHSYASRFARWSDDCRAEVTNLEESVPRPSWLGDRACDNWAPLLAVAEIAGDGWVARALAAAQALSDVSNDDGDLGERLIHDIHAVFHPKDSEGHFLPGLDAIASGDLVRQLLDIETSPWGSIGKAGLTTHRLASLLKPFGVAPRKGRLGTVQLRGYWWSDLTLVFDRYRQKSASECPNCPELSQVQALQGVRAGTIEAPQSSDSEPSVSGLSDDGTESYDAPGQLGHSEGPEAGSASEPREEWRFPK